MTKALVCGVILFSAACSSSGSDGNNGGTTGAGAPAGGAAGVANQAGSAGTPNTAGGNSAGGNSAAGSGGVPTNGGSGGAAGVGGGSGGAGGGAAPVGSGSVTQRGGDSARTSHWLAPTLTKADVMAKMAWDADFKANFDGELTSSPLFLAGATKGTGHFFAATTENDVYSLDELTGATVWKHNIGGYLVNAPVCNADPKHHGIVSTGVLDEANKRLFVAAAMTDGHHEIHALSTDTGMEVAGWPVNVANIKAGNLAFPSSVQNQRSALSLVNGILYVAFGGYCGDGGNYHGWVVGVNSTDPTKIGAWATMDNRQAGIWAAGGLASDGNGVFAITGNSPANGSRDNTDSEEILRITDLATAHRDSANLFYPSEWINPMNSADKDFGSCSPSIVTVPGATPSKIIVAPAKPGRVYFLDAANLGGSLGQFADMVVADTNAQSMYTTPSSYTTSTGVHVAFSTGQGSQCPNNGNANVMSLLLKPSAPGQAPMPSRAWCAPVGGGETFMRAPISTNSAGDADPIVWYMNGGSLNGFDGETGAVLYDSSKGASPSSCAGIHKFTSIIAVNGRIVAGGDSGGKAHLCSWSVH